MIIKISIECFKPFLLCFFPKWSETAVENMKKKKVLFRLFPKLNAANVSLYFRKYVHLAAISFLPQIFVSIYILIFIS